MVIGCISLFIIDNLSYLNLEVYSLSYVDMYNKWHKVNLNFYYFRVLIVKASLR